MIPPARRPPAAPILKVSDVAVLRTIEHHLHYTAMQFFTFNKLYHYFISYYSSGSGSACTLTEGKFFNRMVALFSCSLR